MLNGTHLATIPGMTRPHRNPNANPVSSTHADQPRADRTAAKDEQGMSNSPDDEVSAAEDEDSDQFEDADEEDAEEEDEDEALEGR